MNDQAERMSLEAIQARFDKSPFISTLKLTARDVDYEAAELTVTMPLQPHFERKGGSKQFHGGPIASFIDVVGDFAIGMFLGGGVPTINIRIDYLKPAAGDSLTAVGRVRRQGRSVAVVDIDISNEQDSLVAVGRGTYATVVG